MLYMTVALLTYAIFPQSARTASTNKSSATLTDRCSLTLLDVTYAVTHMLLLDTISFGLTCIDCDHWDKCDGVTTRVSSGAGVEVVEDAGDYSRGSLIQIERPGRNTMRRIELELSHHGRIRITMNYGTCNQNQLANCIKKSARVCLSLPRTKPSECNQNLTALDCTQLVGSTVEISKLSTFHFPFASKFLFACTLTDNHNYLTFCKALKLQKLPSYFSDECDNKTALRLFHDNQEFKSASSFYWDVHTEPEFKFSFKCADNVRINISFFYVNPIFELNVNTEHVSKSKTFELIPGVNVLFSGDGPFESKGVVLSSKNFERVGAEVMVVVRATMSSGRELVAYFTITFMSSKLGFSMSFNRSKDGGTVSVQCRPIGKNVGKQCRIECSWVLVDQQRSSNIINSSSINTNSKNIDDGSHECRCSFECYPKSGVYGPWIYKTKSSAHLQSQIVKQMAAQSASKIEDDSETTVFTWWVILIVSMIAVLMVILLIVFGVRWFINWKIRAKKRLYGSDMPKSRTATFEG